MNTQQPIGLATSPIRVPIELRNRAKAQAAMLGLPLSRFTSQALQREIERSERVKDRRKDSAA